MSGLADWTGKELRSVGGAGGGEGGGQTGDVQSCRFGRLRLTGQGRERENGRGREQAEAYNGNIKRRTRGGSGRNVGELLSWQKEGTGR